MPRNLRLGLALLAFLMAPRAVSAADGLSVTGAWARPSLGQSGNSALYFTILNAGAADTLVSVAGPDAAQAELHASVNEDGVAGMRAMSEMPLPPGQTIAFEPKGNHVMLMGLKRQLQPGDHLTITLRFKSHAPVTLEAAVSMTAPSP